MKARIQLFCILVISCNLMAQDANDPNTAPPTPASPITVRTILPDPNLLGTRSIEWVIGNYNSITTFAPGMVNDAQISQLTWAANITMRAIARVQQLPTRERPGQTGRTQPAQAPISFPLNLYLCTGAGVFRYDPLTHATERIDPMDIRLGISNAAAKNQAFRDAACDIIITSPRSTIKAKPRTVACSDAGQVAHAISLQAMGLGLGTFGTPVFDEKFVARQARLGATEEAVFLLAVGYPLGGIPRAVAPIQRSAAAAPAAAVAKRMPTALIVVPPTFEDQELTAILDLFSVGNIGVRLSSQDTGELRGVHDSRANITLALADVDPSQFDAVVFIGGPGTSELYKNAEAIRVANDTFAARKILAAMGEGGVILANAGLIPRSRVTEQERQKNWRMKSDQTATIPGVNVEGGIITSAGVNNSTLFARAVVDAIRGVTPAERVDQPQVHREQIFRPRSSRRTVTPAD